MKYPPLCGGIFILFKNSCRPASIHAGVARNSCEPRSPVSPLSLHARRGQGTPRGTSLGAPRPHHLPHRGNIIGATPHIIVALCATQHCCAPRNTFLPCGLFSSLYSYTKTFFPFSMDKRGTICYNIHSERDLCPQAAKGEGK